MWQRYSSYLSHFILANGHSFTAGHVKALCWICPFWPWCYFAAVGSNIICTIFVHLHKWMTNRWKTGVILSYCRIYWWNKQPNAGCVQSKHAAVRIGFISVFCCTDWGKICRIVMWDVFKHGKMCLMKLKV